MKTATAALARVRDRHVLIALIVGLAVVLCWQGLADSPEVEAVWLAEDRSGVSVAELLALSALFSIVFRFRQDEFLSSSDLLLIAAASLAFALPLRIAAGAPLAVIGTMFMWRQDSRLRSVGQIMLALVFYEWLGPILFRIISPLALKVETLAVFTVLSLFGEFTMNSLTITGKNGHAIYIEIGCSAFHNLSTAMVVWISLIKLEMVTVKRVHWCILAAMAATTVTLNTVRIALMAQSYPMYDYWHNGAGVPIVSFAMLVAILCIFLGGRRFVEH